MAEFESCDKCKHNMKMPNEEPCCGCIHNAVDKFEPKTNADYIREMSDEKLAEFLECVEAAGYNDSSITPRMENGFPMDMLQWLKSEAKE